MANTEQVEEGNRFTRYRLSLWLAAGAAILAAMVAVAPDWGRAFGLSSETADYFAGFGVGLLLAAAIVTFIKARLAPNKGMPVDALQRLQRRMLQIGVLVIAAIGGLAIIGPMRHGGAAQIDFAIELAFVSIAAAAAVTFGVGFVHRRYRLASSDEFVKALRLRSVQLGYLLAVIGVAAVYVATLFWPAVGNTGLGITLLAAVLVPCIYFLVAERRASGDE